MLSKFSISILKFISVHGIVSLDKLEEQYSTRNNLESTLRYLVDNDYVEEIGLHYINLPNMSPIRDSSNEFKISSKGDAYLENIFENNFLKYYPLVLSTLALIISALALLKSFELIF